MASTIKIKRSASAGNAPNNTNIDTAELALNTADRIMYSSDGTDVFEIGANLTSLAVSGQVTLTNIISANGSVGTAGQALLTDGSSKVYWGDVSSGSSATRTDYIYTANEGQTTFTGADDDGDTLSLGSTFDVFLNGSLISPSGNYTSNSTAIVFTEATGNNDIVTVRNIVTVAGELRNTYVYTANEGQTVFTGSDDNSATLSMTNYKDVFVNGILITDTTDNFTANDTHITFTSGVSNNDIVTIKSYDTVASFSSIDDNGSSTAITIDSSQNVGIGTSSPSTTLDISDSETNPIQLKFASTASAASGRLGVGSTGNAIAVFDDNTVLEGRTGGLALGTNTNDPILFYNTSGRTERMRIDSSGNLLVGTTSATTDLAYAPKLKLSGNGPGLYLEETDASQDYSIAALGGKFYIRDATAVLPRLTIDSSGNVGIGTTSPAATLDVAGTFVVSGGSSVPSGENGIYTTGDGMFIVQNTSQLDDLFLQSQGDITYHSNFDDGTTNADHIFKTGSATEAMRIDGSSGNVGIGTTSPFSDLHLGGGHSAPATSGNMADNGLTISNGAGGRALQIGVDDASARSYIQAGYVNNCNVATHLSFLNGANESMRLGSDGNFYLNTTSSGVVEEESVSYDTSSGRLFINCGVAADQPGLTINNSYNDTGSRKLIDFYRREAFRGNITATTTAVAYNTTSDYRLKENIVSLSGAIDRVKQLEPRRFNFIAEPDTTVDGFVAHEVSDIVPEAIYGEKDGVDEEGNPEYQGIDQSKLVPLLTAALQEAISKIEALEARVTELEG